MSRHVQLIACVAVAVLAATVHAHSHDHSHDHAHDHSHDHSHGHHHTIGGDAALADALTATLLPVLAALGLDPAHPHSMLAVCTALLAFTPLLLVTLIPRNIPRALERVLVAFALGTMLGDLFLHLLPEVFAGHGGHAHGHSHDHDHHHAAGASDGGLAPGLKLVVGFMAFFVLERVMGIVTSLGSGSGGAATATATHEHGEMHSHDHKEHEHEHDEHEHDHKEHDHEEHKDHKHEHKSTPAASIATAGLHTFAMALHTASDGLILSLAMSASPTSGASTFLALFLHEIPHRLADWALMRGSFGLSFTAAFAAQCVLSAASVAGVVAGASLGDAMHRGMAYIAGGLVYVATVSVVPELVGGHHHHHHHDEEGGHDHNAAEKKTSTLGDLARLVVEVGAIVAGVNLVGSHSH
ncbi:ZIP zinc transporter-domain-containing protein [Blastocladiella britannica]|nr:ZIP zinc transporter-domain-containing protein [Blastocladiella britannica]